MEIITCYTADIKSQLDGEKKRRVDKKLMKATADVCLKALRYCTDIFLSEWDYLSGFSTQVKASVVKLGLPDRYSLTFYGQERDLCGMEEGVIGLKLFDGKKWDWYYFKISPSDARYISAVRKTRKMLSPVVEKVKDRYRIRFSFKEKKELVPDTDPLGYRILAVDLGINAAASWCVMESDGTVHGKGVIRLTCEEDRLNHLINRKRMYQQAGKKSKSIYRMVTAANRRLSIETSRKIMEKAVLYDVDCIVFEYLDSGGKIPGADPHVEEARRAETRGAPGPQARDAHQQSLCLGDVEVRLRRFRRSPQG